MTRDDLDTDAARLDMVRVALVAIIDTPGAALPLAKAALDLCNLSTAERAAMRGDTPEPRDWRCFHCDDVFIDQRSASQHFGVAEDQIPACRIKGSDGGLVRALRETEEALFAATSALHSESADGLRAYRGYLARHNTAVRAAEEAGYARGLADARFEMSQ